ncbi:replication protein A 32 kDa subunit-like [Branchiostoma lanceolatum]|uniref:replication protein A 32 kDa subunit-like n=1 Tax=Branchiostoma lanceolatum TaxID=7740 RepID=UPI003455ABF9
MWTQGGGGFGDGGFGNQGGGYLNSPGPNQGGFDSPAPSSQDRKGSRRAQNLLPCTVSHLLQAQQMEDSFRLGETDINQVTIVGVVRNATRAPTNILYKIDDMTGPPMDVRQWLDNDDNIPDEDQDQLYPVNSYIRATGHLRAFQGKKSLVAFKIAPVTDYNELTMHILEVVQAHMMLEKGSQSTGGTSAGMGGQKQNTGGRPTGQQGLVNDLGLNNVQNQVLTMIQSSQDESGVNVSVIEQRLRGISRDAVRNAVEFLSNEGHIYSTIDENHYKSTDSY